MHHSERMDMVGLWVTPADLHFILSILNDVLDIGPEDLADDWERVTRLTKQVQFQLEAHAFFQEGK